MWETVGHHKALVDNKEVYPGLVKSIGESAAKLEFVQHTILSTSTPEDALNAPITEIVFWTLKEGTDKEEFKGIISAFIGKILASDAVKNRGGWGTIVEDDRKFTVILGWNSKEVRQVIFLLDNKRLILFYRSSTRLLHLLPPRLLRLSGS